MSRTLARIREILWRHAATAPIAPTPACRPTRARSRPASCSSRCAGRVSTPTISSRPRRPRARRAPWSMPRSSAPLAQIVVADTQAALSYLRRRLARAVSRCPIVGVAGSNGKTTVKEMTAAILERAGQHARDARQSQQPHRRAAHAAPPRWHAALRGHRNRRQSRRRSGRPREARAALRSASSPTPEPSISRASAASRAWRAPRAKWWRDSNDFGHRGDQRRRRIRRRCGAAWRAARISTFGVAQPRIFRRPTSTPRSTPPASSRDLRLRAPAGAMPIELHLAGGHNVLNALCAAAAATAAGASLDDVRAGLATMRPVPGRLQFKTAPSGAWIVDDSYNANPSSMKAGIEVLASVDARRWLVMGDMGELGEFCRCQPWRDRPLRARSPHRSAVRHRPAVGARGRGLRCRAPNGSRTPRRWRARSMPSSRAKCACW